MTQAQNKLSGLSSAKRAVLFDLLRKKRQAEGGTDRIEPREDRLAPLPLSFSQLRLWFLDRLHPGDPVYNLPSATRILGTLHLPSLALALAGVADRHEALRTTFAATEDGEPVQVIAPRFVPRLPVVDLGALPAARRNPEIRRMSALESRLAFDLEKGPLLRGCVFRCADDEHLLLLEMHHIVSDGWSMGVLVNEIGALYPAFLAGQPSPLPELAVQYPDFAVWQRRRLSGALLEAELGWWCSRLAGMSPVLELPADHPRQAVRSTRGAGRTFLMDPAALSELQALSRRHEATLFMTLLAGFFVVLQRYTGEDDLAVATPIAGRIRAELGPLIGFFVNTLVLRTDLGGNPSFSDLLTRVRETTLSSYSHQELPFERLVEELAPERDLSRPPLVQVMFAMENTPEGALEHLGIKIIPEATGLGVSKFELTCTCREIEEGLFGMLEYSRELFEAPTMVRLGGHLERLLSGVLAEPQRPLAEIALLAPGERHQLLAEWNDTAVDYPRGHTLHELVAAQADRTPGAVAAVDENEQVTYRELVDRARQLASHLARLGVKPDGRVGVLLERSLAMITGLLGVLEAGAAYVPLDPTLPGERLATLAENAGLSAVVTQDRFSALLPVGGPPVVFLDAGGGRAWRSDGSVGSDRSVRSDRPGQAMGEGLAYVLYTSGSTGTPKGVMIPHQGIVNRLQWMQEAYGLTAEDRVLQKTPFGFDVSVWEFFWPLLCGARLVFAQPEGHKDPRYLADLIAREKITTVHFVPSMLEVFLETPGLEALASLRRVVASGEALPPQLVRRFFSRLPHAELHNLYGPTEASVDVSFWPCVPEPPGDVVPIGRPIANHQLHVVDRSLAPQPVGVPGELLLGGPGLARGYLGRPDLTAAVFIPDPFGEGAGGRLYRTGDLVRRLADGMVHYLGRIDHQVKIRGFRIELGEIEAALAQLPGVREAVVLVREDETGDKRLAAYIANTVTALEPAPVPEDLRTALRRTLPEAMVPAEVTVLPSLPLNANGKIDRRALARIAPAAIRPVARFLAPQGPVEEVLAQIWTEVLGGERRGLARIGAQDDFFTLGGHSLLATQVMSRVRNAFGVELPLRAFFEAPTVTALAARIDGERRGEHAQPSPILPVPRDRDLPLSFAQQRLWFLDRLAPDNPFYNMYGAVRLTGVLDLDALRGAFREIVRRQEALRTTFQPGEHGPVQVIAPAPSFEVPLVDLEGLAEDLRRRELARLSGDEARRPFNLARGPLVRAALLRIAAQEHTLLVNLHHIISDGWSMGILFHELASLYGAFSLGAPSPLPELPIQYADFAVWQREWLSGERLAAELDYWRRQLAGIPESLEMPFDHPRPAAESFRGATETFALPVELARALSALTRRRGATQSMTLLAGFTALLGRFAGCEDVAVGMAIANRTRREVEGLIGFFVNTLVLRTDLSGTPGFAQLVGRVRETSLASYAHQDLPFERLVEELQPERSLSRNPLVQVMFGYQNFPRAEAEVRGLTLSLPEEGKVAGGTAKFDLSLFLFEDGDHLTGALEYNREIFEAATMLRLLRCFENLLAAAVADPEAPVAFLPLLDAAERHQLACEWNDSASDWPSTSSFQELFLEHVRRAPDAPAVIAGTASLSYADLNGRADGLARALRHRGAGPGSFVGLCVERSAQAVVALVAILKTGAAYVPLDPDYPAERLALMMEDCDLRLLVVDDTARTRLPQGLLAGRETVTPEDFFRLPEEGGVMAEGGQGGEALSHIIYTSGSTGRPKGVALSHRAVVRLVRETDYVHLGPGDRVAQVSSLNFDPSTYEIWGALLNGATLVVIPRDTVLSPPGFAAALSEHRINNMVLTSALFAQMAREEPDAFAGLRELFVGGETVDPAAARRVLAGRPPQRLLNLYGPAENTTYSSWYPIRSVPEGSLPIGSPVANTTLHVVDRWLQPVPLGVVGELAIGGQGLAWGYWRRPELTAERFVPDFAGPAGSRLYRTGDLVRRRADGILEILGRIDHQVKIRGFRIELGEIEARLAEHPVVRQAVVLAREDVPGDKRLAAYVVQNPAYETAESGEQTEQVSQWGEIFDDLYREEAPEADPTFNIIGWNSTYTGLPLPASEMEEWLDDTIRGIAALEPRRVLEIGCGTGMILFRIAPRCEAYTGIDVSGRALRSIESQLGRVGLSDGRVRLLRKPAHELDGLAADSVDTVVLNSVAQYFPSADYLAEVVERAVELVRPGGAVFLGDLRSLPLLAAFHTALELFQADPATPLSRLRQKVHARHMDENELAIDPAFFTALRERLPKLGRIEIHLKRGRAHNELTGFRYQAVLRVGTGREEPARDGVLDWRRERLTLAALRRRLAEEAPQVVRLRNIPNARVAEDTAAVRLLQEAPEGIETAADLRRRAAEAALGAVEPQDLRDLAKDLPYEVELSWADQGADGSFEATIRTSSGLGEGPKARASSAQGNALGGEGPLAAASLAAYANNPLQGRFARRIVPELRAFLEARLPAYMMPSAFVLLDALPITPNGKIDRRRLPAPGGSPESGRSLVAARNATEERLLAIWKELLGVERIGVEDDFFALGGHSLLATQAISRVRQAFGVELPLRTFFAAPSVASVAAEISRLRLGGGEADVPPIVPVPRDGRLPLSFAQERLWFLDRLEARTLAYNEAAAFRLEGPLDIAAFRGALDEILLRHESLRTAFPEVDGEAVQVIRPAAPFEIPEVDLRALPQALHGEEVHRLALSQALRPFSLAHGPLVRGLLMRLGGNDHAVLFSFHHIIFDGWSVGVFVRELSALYRARIAGVPASLPPLAIQYADFAAWQRGWLQGEVLERQVAWWRGQLTGAAVLELPTDRPRPILAQAPSGLLHPLLQPSLTEPLRAFSRGHGATLFMTLLAGFQALLHRHTGQTDISVGTPSANRNHGDVEKLIGFFVNMLVMRTDLSGDPGFGDLVDRVRQTALGTYDHQSVPFAKLVEELRPERDLRHTPLFQVSFQVLNVPQSPLELPGITLHPLSFAARSAKFDLDLALTDAADRLAGVLDYNADLFDATTMERFLAHFRQLLTGAVENPAQRLSDLPLLTPGERSQIEIEWNDTATSAEAPACLHHLIAQRIAEAPEALAVVCEDRRLTYGDLGRQSASLALRLRELGAGPGVPVVHFLDRSVEAIVGFAGILEAGGVYVPVDPAYPAERVAWILEDCRTPIVVTTSGLAGRLPNGTPAVLLDDLGGGAPLPEAGEGVGEGSGVRLLADHPAYIIYTSGSTGRPKGVVVQHGAMVSFARALREAVYGEVYGEKAGALRVGFNSSFSFDASIQQLVQLAWGHSLHVLPQAVRLDPAALVDTVRRQQLDVLDCTPSQLRLLLNAGLGEGDAAPALVLVGGEAVDADLRDAALARSRQGRTRFWNVYGPTECTVDTTATPFTAGTPPTRIGRPLPNVRVHVVTASGNLAPLGVSGELRIGGAGLARAYLGRPDLTAERFVPDPFGGYPGGRLYRSGDLVRWLPDGSLDFLGRLDNQVKVRGYRIELGEIEAALGGLPGVREAVVVAKSDRSVGSAGSPGDLRLVAYVTGEVDTAALRQALRDKLPDFMLPSAMVALPALPLTPSGKVDRKALPEPDSGPAPGFVAPRTAVEEVLAEIWAELLGIAHIGVHDNFFERGGHSLLAVLLMARIEKRLGTTLPLAALFSAPTLEALAALAETSGGHPAGRKGRGSLVAIKPATNRDTDQAPFFCVHPIGGNVLCYLDLARHLAPDQPFYALQTPDDRPPTKSIEEMAARYLAEVRRVQPQGPYRLGGWSMGGLVAFAMARQLAAEGQAPELLALIDTLPPETATAPATDEELVASFAQDMARLLGSNVGISPEELRSLPEQEKLAHVVRLGHTAGLLPADFGLAQIEPLFATFAANLQAIRAYAPEPYTGRLTLWVSEATAASYAAALDVWSRLVPAGLDRTILPGDHYSLLRRPEVERLARELTAQLVRNKV
ncbi:MAG TPA: amino acid adenylation domain-containing protein [Thermoanaerobaculia bacterium]|nr:amino acid adenylation domain-containing protein [Thermoanaerobaculia bacterium]